MPKSEHFADYPDADGYAMVIGFNYTLGGYSGRARRI